MVTIYDIAEATGYSAPTVSKALNGLGSLSEKTRQKILDKAKEMGYEPNITARTLTTKKSNLIPRSIHLSSTPAPNIPLVPPPTSTMPIFCFVICSCPPVKNEQNVL